MGGAAAWWSAACERKGGDGYYLESPRNGRVTWARGGRDARQANGGPALQDRRRHRSSERAAGSSSS
eukprot:COSAG01_NODE_35704_length_527_cov_35.341121_1_plen_66_part_01